MHNREKKLRILLSGGGTGGSIAPLLAIAEEIMSRVKGPDLPTNRVDVLWVGTKKGIEKEMVDNFKNSQNTSPVPPQSPERDCGEKIKFKAIHNGKLRRYFDFQNFIDPFFIILGFFQSFWIIVRYKPDIILTSGSFIAVPVVWAGWILRVPVLVHQQDVKVGLANKLMAPFAGIITCSLEESVRNFQHNAGETSPVRRAGKSSLRQIYFTGNAVRRKILEAQRRRHVDISPSDKNNIPTLLILGGGTGALAVNTIIIQSLPELSKICNVIHMTGGKLSNGCRDEALPRLHSEHRYQQHLFLNNIEEAYAAADLVISRAGMGVLSELAILGKPTIIIPIPDSHQEANAKYFGDRNAAIILNQKELTPEILIYTVRGLLKDKNKTRELSENISKIMPSDGASRIAKIVMKYILK